MGYGYIYMGQGGSQGSSNCVNVTVQLILDPFLGAVHPLELMHNRKVYLSEISALIPFI